MVLMHMADSLLAPSVGLVMMVVSFGALAYSLVKMKKSEVFTDKMVPVMGIMAAFIFAAQMINFSIPGTGSSGHLCGGMILAATLGMYPAVLSLAIVLVIQCLFFADGGLLAIGCNIFNMGLCAILVAYPLIYKPLIAKSNYNPVKVFIASILACVVGLELGAFCVTIETMVSGITALPFTTFLGLMLPIHLAIGTVEGVITALVVLYIHAVRPELLDQSLNNRQTSVSFRKLVVTFAVVSVFVAGGLSLFASGDPDGLEWSIFNITGDTEVEAEDAYLSATETAGAIVEKTAFLPDYAFASDEENPMGTTVSGLVGGTMCVVVAGAAAYLLKNKKTA